MRLDKHMLAGVFGMCRPCRAVVFSGMPAFSPQENEMLHVPNTNRSTTTLRRPSRASKAEITCGTRKLSENSPTNTVQRPTKSDIPITHPNRIS